MLKNVHWWVPFVATSLLTFIVYRTAWATSFYWPVLCCLGIAAVALSIGLLRQTRLRLWPLVGVACGLLIGQWWFVQFVVLFAFWKLRGFAP